MYSLIQLKKATSLFVIALVLACLTLSLQAFASLGKVAKPTFTYATDGCGRSVWHVSTTTSGATIRAWGGGAGQECVNSCNLPIKPGGRSVVWAYAYKSFMTNSDYAWNTYTSLPVCTL